MTFDVTVLGAAGATVTVPFTSAQNAAAAQRALGAMTNYIRGGFYSQQLYTGSGTLPGVAPGFLVAGAVIGGSTDVNDGYLPASYLSTVINNTGFTSEIDSPSPNQTIVSGSGGLQLLNIAQNTQVFLGGGSINSIIESYATSSAIINVDANPGTFIDGSLGSTTVNVFSGAFVDFLGTAGHNIVNLMPGPVQETVGATGSGGAITINGATGASLDFRTYAGGLGFINPGASDVTVNGGGSPGVSGSTTIFGGSVTIGGIAYTNNAFTGKLTAGFAEGYLKGGSNGGNVMQTGTVPGAATLVGNGDGDVLFNQGTGTLLIAGSGNETLSGSTVIGAGTVPGVGSVGGSTFIAGAGKVLITGNAGGADTIGGGSGSATIFGFRGAGPGNTYYQDVAGGTDIIYGFVEAPGGDRFNLAASAGHPSLVSLVAYAASGTTPFGLPGTQAILSDGTTIKFADATVTRASFIL